MLISSSPGGEIEGDHVTVEESVLKEFHRKFSPLGTRPRFSEQKFHIDHLKSVAKQRGEGYLEFVLARGKVEGDVVTLDAAAFREVRQKFPPPAQPRRPAEPTVAEMAANFTQAMAGWVSAGFKVVERDVYERRHAICLACEYWDAQARGGLGKCKKCGCARAKLWLAPSKCPLQPPKW